MTPRFPLVWSAAALGLAGFFLWSAGRMTADEKSAPDKAAVDRARETAKMLDDLYKNYVVQITATYVGAQEKTPAAHVTKQVFKAMAAKGWHTGRLVDATGTPLRSANAPTSAFEKQAIPKIKAGTPYVEEVGTDQGKPVLRVATVVPVVMKQCIACHPGTKEGDVLGALVYEIPIK
jgi:hypothetical protein